MSKARRLSRSSPGGSGFAAAAEAHLGVGWGWVGRWTRLRQCTRVTSMTRAVGRALCGASHRSLAIEAKSGAVILLAAAECVRFESCATVLNFTWSCLGLGLPWKAKLEIILIVQETATPSQRMIPRCDPSLVLSCLGVLEDQTQGKP